MNRYDRSFYRRQFYCTIKNFSRENLPKIKKANFVLNVKPFSNNLEFQFCSQIKENINYLKCLIIINDSTHDSTINYSAKFSIIQSDGFVHFCNESKLDGFVKLDISDSNLITIIDVEEIFTDYDIFMDYEILRIHIALEATKYGKEPRPKINLKLKNYENLVNNPEFSDLKIICSDNKIIYAHKCILMTSSPQINSLFGSIIESQMQENQNDEIRVNDIEFKVMLELMRFNYASKVNNFKKVGKDLLVVADKYNFMGLKNFCIKLLEKHLNSENVVDLLKISNILKVDKLKENCIDLIKFNFDSISTRSDYQELPSEILHSIIKSMNAEPPKQEFIFDLSEIVEIVNNENSFEPTNDNSQVQVMQHGARPSIRFPYFYNPSN